MVDPTRERNFRVDRVSQAPKQERKGSPGDRKRQLGQRKGPRTMALKSSACLGLVPPGLEPHKLGLLSLSLLN